jgi:hypothetical protein
VKNRNFRLKFTPKRSENFIFFKEKMLKKLYLVKVAHGVPKHSLWSGKKHFLARKSIFRLGFTHRKMVLEHTFFRAKAIP